MNKNVIFSLPQISCFMTGSTSRCVDQHPKCPDFILDPGLVCRSSLPILQSHTEVPMENKQEQTKKQLKNQRSKTSDMFWSTPADSLNVFQVWRCFGYSWCSYPTCDMINLSAADFVSFLLSILEDRNAIFKSFLLEFPGQATRL